MINVTSMPNLDCEDEKPQKASKSITEASQWRARPVVPVVPSPSPSRSQSSVASTSKVTLDSASSWISNDSGTDRPSSATSATSTYSETPQSKPILLPEFFYRHSSLDSTPGADKRPTNAASVPSAASQGQSTHFLSQYEPKVDLNGRSMIYPTDSKPRVRPAEKRKRERVHIYYDKHKQSLVPRREAVRENLKRVAYLKSKSQGYKGTEEEHDQFVDYAALTLQAVEKPGQSYKSPWLRI
ncbi:hypothetical protein DFP72DRAFT_9744 [Ephemerocybe angulata]|uniref:Uncharacterized protein n=1 Tax=Ephemerocybe angulata TaxID=980116 RepID=A0A8H6IKJ5_9AGAR|nr:hypothetical protein DFP72DRAFT_9744 [Tulosesus angulatus]